MGIIIILIFVVCGIYVQNRGKVKHQKLTRQLTDHSNFLGPINCIFYAFSSVKKSPYVDLEAFPELQVLKENWQEIRDEALRLNDAKSIKASEDLDDVGFNSFFKTGWKRFYLKWYGSSLESAKSMCPKTVELLEGIKTVKAGMFAMLPPGARLVKHRDPYAGSMRYHLGLDVPESNDCYINVDGEDYSWRNGEAVMFDETFIHFAENQTDKNRIILFLDVKRPVNFFLADWLNTAFSRIVMSASATKNVAGDRVGFLNRIFGYLYQIRRIGKKLKNFNRTLYYFVQYSIYILIIYSIVR